MKTTKRAATAASIAVVRASFGRSTRCNEEGWWTCDAITSRTSTARTNLTFPMTTGVSSLMDGETGIRLVLHQLAPSSENADRLAELIAQNAEDEHCEVFWGSPGTMLAATAMHELTGEARWLDLWRDSAAWLIDQWDPQTDLWTQRFPRRAVEQWIGPAHGFAGCVLALASAC